MCSIWLHLAIIQLMRLVRSCFKCTKIFDSPCRCSRHHMLLHLRKSLSYSSRCDSLFILMSHRFVIEANNTSDFRLPHVKENFQKFCKSSTLSFCLLCRFDTHCPVNENCIRAVLVTAYYGNLLKNLRCKDSKVLYPTLAQCEYFLIHR